MLMAWNIKRPEHTLQVIEYIDTAYNNHYVNLCRKSLIAGISD